MKDRPMIWNGKHTFWRTCVNFEAPREVQALSKMIEDAFDVSRKTFLKHVRPEAMRRLEKQLGYSTTRDGGLYMCNDYHVSYHRSMIMGRTCYFFRHSAIEYIFMPEDWSPGWKRQKQNSPQFASDLRAAHQMAMAKLHGATSLVTKSNLLKPPLSDILG